MAGAGKKTFVAGEVLTAAQVNDYLMDQAVMRFSGSAARAASLTPTEGMVTYLDDVNQMEFYDGSDWVRLEVNSDDLRNLITASAELLVGIAAGSIVALPPGEEGQVLTINPSSSTGLAWIAPSGAGAQAVATVSASNTNTALSSSLSAGFYKISTNVSTTWNSTQFRFVDTAGNFYGADLTAGNGTFTIPVNVASVNITTGTFPIRVIVEELSTITTNLIPAPVVTDFEWTVVNGGSASITPQPAAASFGAFQLTTGSFSAIAPAAASAVSACIAGGVGAIGSEYPMAIVAQDAATGLWSTAPTASTAKYPFAVFTGNGTMDPIPWATTLETWVIAGGGGGGGGTVIIGPTTSRAFGGGGGAGGASLFSLAASTSYSVTIGAGGAAGPGTANGTAGNPTTVGSASVAGGGYGGGATASPRTAAAGGPGGSGGGAGAATTQSPFSPPANVSSGAAGGAGIAGQGFDGATTPTGPGLSNIGGGGGGVSAAGGSPILANGGAASLVWGYSFAAGGKGGEVNVGSAAAGTGGGGSGQGHSAPGGTTYPSTSGGAGLVLIRAV